MNLADTTALVTGANRGIGRALVERLAARPLALVLAGARSPVAVDLADGVASTASSGAARALADDDVPTTPPPGGARMVRGVHMDLSSRESIEECCAELGEELGRIDVLVNNAGLMTGGLLEEQEMEDVYAMFQVNLVAVAHLTRRVLPGMLARGTGVIVNNSSISGYAHLPAASTYAASKAGVVAFSEALRRELRGTGVRVLHLVTPGVATDMLDATESAYGRHMDTSGWGSVPPAQWAERAVAAIEDDRRVLGPGGRLALLKLAADGPAELLDALAARMFSRTPRG